MSNPIVDDRTNLIDAWLDGERCDAGEFEAWLRAEPGRIEEFVEASLLHRALREAAIAGQLHAGDDAVPTAVESQSYTRGASVPSISASLSYFAYDHPFAFSYLVATVLFAIAAVAGHFYKVQHYTQYARSFGTQEVASTVPSTLSSSSIPSPVARITGMVDVKWWAAVRGQGSGGVASGQWLVASEKSKISKFPNFQIPNPKYVALGDKLELASGLLQLTYNSGAKVVLQGPCTYEVNSPTGGFLALGKLTARVKGSGVGSRESGLTTLTASAKPQASTIHHSSFSTHHSPNPQSPIPNPLFVLRTPTATITDLGTEFGVEVDAAGKCEVHVLEGLVQASFLASTGQVAQTINLHEGEARRWSPDLAQAAPIQSERKKFAALRIDSPNEQRERWLAYCRRLHKDPALVAHYTFDRHDRGNWILPNQSAAGSALDGHVESAEWVDGRLPGKMALYFHGPGSGDRVELPEPQRFNFTGPFSVAVWFKVGEFTNIHQPLIGKGDDCWRLQQGESEHWLRFATNSSPEIINRADGQANVADGRWHLAVAVYEPAGQAASQRLYIDGRLDGQFEAQLPLHHNDVPVLLGANDKYPDRTFRGLIDEAVIFARPLSDQEIEQMYDETKGDNWR